MAFKSKPAATNKRSRFSLRHLSRCLRNQLNYALASTAEFLQSLRTDKQTDQEAADVNIGTNISPSPSLPLGAHTTSQPRSPRPSISEVLVVSQRDAIAQKHWGPNCGKQTRSRGESTPPNRDAPRLGLTLKKPLKKPELTHAAGGRKVSLNYKLVVCDREAVKRRERIAKYKAELFGRPYEPPAQKKKAKHSGDAPREPLRPVPIGPPNPKRSMLEKAARRIREQRRKEQARRQREKMRLEEERLATPQKSIDERRRLMKVAVHPVDGRWSRRQISAVEEEERRRQAFLALPRTPDGRIIAFGLVSRKKEYYNWQAKWAKRRTPPVCGKRKRVITFTHLMEEPRWRKRRLA